MMQELSRTSLAKELPFCTQQITNNRNWLFLIYNGWDKDLDTFEIFKQVRFMDPALSREAKNVQEDFIPTILAFLSACLTSTATGSQQQEDEEMTFGLSTSAFQKLMIMSGIPDGQEEELPNIWEALGEKNLSKVDKALLHHQRKLRNEGLFPECQSPHHIYHHHHDHATQLQRGAINFYPLFS